LRELVSSRRPCSFLKALADFRGFIRWTSWLCSLGSDLALCRLALYPAHSPVRAGSNSCDCFPIWRRTFAKPDSEICCRTRVQNHIPLSHGCLRFLRSISGEWGARTGLRIRLCVPPIYRAGAPPCGSIPSLSLSILFVVQNPHEIRGRQSLHLPVYR